MGTVKAKEGEEDLLEQFWTANHYVAGSNDMRDFKLLNQEMVAVEKGHANRLFYLALPPSVFKPVTSMLKVTKSFDLAGYKNLKRVALHFIAQQIINFMTF